MEINILGNKDTTIMNNNMCTIIYHPNGKIKIIQWFNDKNELHRDDDQPALIRYNEDGSMKEEHWINNGVRYRDNDKPVVIIYSDNMDLCIFNPGADDILELLGDS